VKCEHKLSYLFLKEFFYGIPFVSIQTSRTCIKEGWNANVENENRRIKRKSSANSLLILAKKLLSNVRSPSIYIVDFIFCLRPRSFVQSERGVVGDAAGPSLVHVILVRSRRPHVLR